MSLVACNREAQFCLKLYLLIITSVICAVQGYAYLVTIIMLLYPCQKFIYSINRLAVKFNNYITRVDTGFTCRRAALNTFYIYSLRETVNLSIFFADIRSPLVFLSRRFITRFT